MTQLQEQQKPWYAEVSTYEWVVLIVACAGWIFDIYEAQIFAVTRGNMLSELLHTTANSPEVKRAGDNINSLFLIGGAIGGVLFGVIADRFGRGLSMVLSILVYAIFSATTAAAHTVQQVAILRFFVAMGTGGEWAVAAALVAEVFPKRARAHASGIFHASSVLGGLAAFSVSYIAGPHWRWVFLIGLAPALLTLVVRFYVREPIKMQVTNPDQAGFSEFWRNPIYLWRAVLGLLLAAVGLAGYWGVYVAGQDLARDFLLHHGVSAAAAEPQAMKAYSVYQLIGGGIGLFSMGPLCAFLGRKKAFILMQAGALIATPIACFLPTTYGSLLLLLPLMAFFVNGMHAGYAVWFPELFPTRLRATGAGICFNGARLLAAPALYFSGWLKSRPGMNLSTAVFLLSTVYLVGIIVASLMPETKGKPLPD